MATKILEFFVPGIPAPGGSKRAFIPKGWTRPVITEAGGKRNKDWRAVVALSGVEAMRLLYAGRAPELILGPLEFAVKFVMPRPEHHYSTTKKFGRVLKKDAPYWVTKAPDVTKLARSTEDALTGVIWRDDAQISVQHLERVYGIGPGATIQITLL